MQFISDIELIYKNCCDYNGDDSEYSELSAEMCKLFQSLVKIHFEGKSIHEDQLDGKAKKAHNRQSRSPSACKTPELTSESSSEEDSDDGRWALLIIMMAWMNYDGVDGHYLG